MQTTPPTQQKTNEVKGEVTVQQSENATQASSSEAVRKLLEFELIETEDVPDPNHGHSQGCLSCS